MNKFKRRYIILRNKFRYFGSGRMVADRNGQPHGIVWFTVCTGLGNFRLFPVGCIK